MREMGVRFNDIPSILRANRWHATRQAGSASAAGAQAAA
jgi:hypothetical protein